MEKITLGKLFTAELDEFFRSADRRLQDAEVAAMTARAEAREWENTAKVLAYKLGEMRGWDCAAIRLLREAQYEAKNS